MDEHFSESGIGFMDMKKIYNIILVGKTRRTSNQIDEVAKYLKRTLKSLEHSDYRLMRMLVEKLHVAEFKTNEVVLDEGEEDNVQLIVLEGSVSKIRDRRVLSTFVQNQSVGEDVTIEQRGPRKLRNFYVKANTPAKVMLLSRNGFSTTKGMYDLDRERLCHRLL